MKTLLFVYNANSGIGNMILDVAHKFFSPKTYACHLCALTYDTFSENRIWKDFRTKSNIDFTFLHIDEFETKYPKANFSYPIILEDNNAELSIVFDKAQINALTSVEGLIHAIEAKSFG